MFIDSGDFWVSKLGADYLIYWDQYQNELEDYRNAGMWSPTFFRHNEGANIAFFDNHVEYLKKEDIFHYDSNTNLPDIQKNNSLWYLQPSNYKSM